MTIATLTHQMTIIQGLHQLRHYASTHPHSAGWDYAIDTILARREVSRG